MRELRAIACNYVEPTRMASRGAKAYVLQPNGGNAGDRLQILLRSRGGRWIVKWEDRRRLGTFRVVTVVEAEGKVFEVLWPWRRDPPETEKLAAWLTRGAEHRQVAHPLVDAETLQRVRRGPKP